MAKFAALLPAAAPAVGSAAAIAASPGFVASLPAIAGFSAAPAVGTGLTLSGLATAAQVAGAGVAAAGAVAGGQAAGRSAQFQSAILQQQAQRERQNARLEAEDFRRDQRRLMARRRAMLGASGVEAGTGSPLLVSEDFAREGELQARRIEAGGDVRSTRLQQQARLQRFSGASASRAGFLRGGSLLLTGAGEAFG